MKVITKARGRFKYQVQEQTTGYVYRSFPTQAEAQKYIAHTDGVLEQAEPVSNSQGVCKDCGNGTLNNELEPAFIFVYDAQNDTDVLVCNNCYSTHLDVL